MELYTKKCIIVSANDKYVPYLSVLLSSVRINSKPSMQLEIVVLFDEISADNRKKLSDMMDRETMSIRFLNVHEKLSGHTLFVHGTGNRTYLTKEAYFRLLAPQLLPEYDKALYLDCDIVVCDGWEEIYNVELDDKLLAGIPDLWGNWECYDKKSELYSYRQQELGMQDPLQYFNSGVMLLNLKAMRETFRDGELIELAASKDWQKHDQDVLNYISKDRNIFLDYTWNLIECPSKKAWNAVPGEQQEEYESCSMRPVIIHYASRKPWIIKGVAREQEFWKAASNSSFFDELMNGFIEEQLSQGKNFEERVYNSIRCGKIGVKFIARCILTYVKRLFGKS